MGQAMQQRGDACYQREERREPFRPQNESAAMSRTLTLAILAAAMTFASSQASAARLRSPLIGTWQLVRFEDTDTKGKVETPFGEHPKGYFVYDDTGHLSVQIMANPPVPTFAANAPGSPDTDKATDAEIRKAYDSYVAYFGTWRINAAGSVVTHVVEGALNPAYTGTDQPRPFTLKGDVLIISATNSEGSYYRELHRVR